jgi:hypothetical protein
MCLGKVLCDAISYQLRIIYNQVFIETFLEIDVLILEISNLYQFHHQGIRLAYYLVDIDIIYVDFIRTLCEKWNYRDYTGY